MVASQNLSGVMVSTVDRKARGVGSIPDLGAIFAIFIKTHDTGCRDEDPVQTVCCMVVEPTLCMHMEVAHCLYVIVSIK